MSLDEPRDAADWNPWASIPPEYNLGEALTRTQVAVGRGAKVALHWENAAHASRSLSYLELDALSSRLASSLATHGVPHTAHVFAHGPHSLGLAEGAGDTAEWTTLAASWIIEQSRARATLA